LLDETPIFPTVSFECEIAAMLGAVRQQKALRVIAGRAWRESSNATGPKRKRMNAISFFFSASHGGESVRRNSQLRDPWRRTLSNKP